jgi:glycosyltransferase involved in cell wall biosynthesis
MPMNKDKIIGQRPKISVITPSLNHGRFLRDTIESIKMQTMKDFEHIVVDGGSTDDTLEILREYPHVRWISEKETDNNKILEAYRKAIAMSRGDYVMQCCVSDGYLDKDWFRKCASMLDSDIEVSLVWGLAQHMTEDGNLGSVTNPEYLEKTPPGKTDFLPFWLTFGFGYPESNYCIRREVLDICFPPRNSEDPLSTNIANEFLYKFNAFGYLSIFLPAVASFGRSHCNQLSTALYETLDYIQHLYIKRVKQYRRNLLSGKIKHEFRDGSSKVIGQVTARELMMIRKRILIHYVKHKIRKRLNELLEKL